ncbi:30S ribosomal protein S17 [Candidatus Berkelbacteria bacterium RBG_13_40_8]|uniref:Small ribosomal subunit protein uS17 n=1 Tax=Candidatus Berkelbacteria bacterium RBG_13_40_8 TaxID=1797467 RepID=A0A1F5DQF9_9BACT|nr:MAG: 30S ribosomal protein S17 [Candidatus Berkelbacteria bacterium RBG_13_40_8]
MKKLIGKVIRDKMQKTRVVEIVEMRRHPIYHKGYPVTTKIKAHDEGNAFKEGDIVEIAAVRPLSKDKAWKIIRKVK